VKIVLEYIKYLWKAKGRHGVHSPFVYNFLDTCLKIPKQPNLIAALETLKHQLIHEDRTIHVTDLGAGSKKLSTKRSVKKMYQTSSSKGKYGDLLFKIAAHYSPKNMLELGTSIGVGTLNLHYGNPSANLITVEGCPQTHQIALQHFAAIPTKNIQAIHAHFQDFLGNYSGNTFDLVFIDGHHDGEALLRYLDLLDPFTHNETLFLLDDIRWSNSMLKAWNTIQKDPSYAVSIDLFRMGIILKRKQQRKEHFTLRF
jgi:predicted O-methyltransferase YrrM